MLFGEQDAIVSCIAFTVNQTKQMAKIERLRWLGHPFKMQGLNHCRKLRRLSLLTPEGN